MTAVPALRAALRKSANRHWLARLIIGAWVFQIPLFGFLSPESLMGRALDRTSHMGLLMMTALLAFSSLALADSLISDILPARFSTCLMHYRHVGFMSMALVLVITGGGFAVTLRAPLVLSSFLVPALFCVVVTVADLWSRHLWSR